MKSAAEIAISKLLDQRGAGKTVCPSEAAKHLARGGENWREYMAQVHKAVDTMVEAGSITLTWKGEMVDRRRGPYRIARRQPT